MYVLVDNDNNLIKFPFSPSELKHLHPNVSFPVDMPDRLLAEYNVKKTKTSPRPAINEETETFKRTIQRVGDDWHVVYKATLRPKDEIISNVKERIQQHLDRTNDLVLSFLEINQPVPEWLGEYRKALRAIPEQDEYPYKITWPDQPEGVRNAFI